MLHSEDGHYVVFKIVLVLRRDTPPPPALNLLVPIYTPGWREALCE